ncbi:MAG: RecQ family zinc-binding domain-containing protein [Burkholderiales bacterium]
MRIEDRTKLGRMVFYGQTGQCRWRVPLDRFGERIERDACATCDNPARAEDRQKDRARDTRQRGDGRASWLDPHLPRDLPAAGARGAPFRARWPPPRTGVSSQAFPLPSIFMQVSARVGCRAACLYARASAA